MQQISHGNVGTATGTVKVRDNILPVITVENTPVSMIQGTDINMLEGVTATDNIDGDLTNKITYISNPTFNKNLIGIYIIIYTVKDSAGNLGVAEKTVEILKDEIVPTAIMSYEMKIATEVIATMTTSEKIQTPSGWTKVSDTVYTKKYTANSTETVPITDMFGNIGYANVEITGILPAGWVGIYTANQLYSIGNNVAYALNKQYILMNDIDLSMCSDEIDEKGLVGSTAASTNWKGVLNFSGQLDGNGYTIRGLKINNLGTANQGLFSSTTTTSVIKNLTLENVDIKGGTGTGAIAGTGAGTITNVKVTGQITSNGNSVGGLIGISTSTITISKCYSNVSISSTGSYVGGIIGQVKTGTITTSYASGNVTGSTRIGGFIGYALTNTLSISKCYASGEVNSSGNYAGGFIGHLYEYYSGTTSVSNSYSVGNVTGVNYVGGFVGYQQVYNTTSSYKLNLLNCYSLGKVTGTARGGFCGTITSSSYNTSKNTYYVINTAGIATSAGGTGLSIDKATQKISFNAWDFNGTWDLIEVGEDKTTPYLKDLIIPEKVYVKNLEFLEGAGTEDDPFLIYNEDQLYNIKDMKTANYKIMNDIAMVKYTNWMPITDFSGSLDGNGYAIKNLTISRLGTANQGLFANTLAGVTIKNLTLENVNIKGGGSTGALVGTAASTLNIDNIIVTGNIQGNGVYVGGIVGTGSVNITNSKNKANITTSTNHVGGIIGYISGVSNISMTYSSGNVTGTSNYVGGLVRIY